MSGCHKPICKSTFIKRNFNAKKMSTCRKLIIVFLTIIGVFHFTASAQDGETIVSGTVKNEAGAVMPGVTVLQKGTSAGTVTNEDGFYKLTLIGNENLILEFTFTGYKTQEINISGNTTVDVTLSLDTKGLDEIVVIGYGTARRKDVTGSVASVQTAKLETEAPRSVQDLLRGNAAGIIIGQGNSAKADASFLVRGSGTLKAGNSPLNVVEGLFSTVLLRILIQTTFKALIFLKTQAQLLSMEPGLRMVLYL